MARQFSTDVLLPNISPSQDNHASRKKYVDDQDALRIPLTARGQANGVGSLGVDGKQPIGELASHAHNASDVSAGTLDVARLPRVLVGTSENTTSSAVSYVVDVSANAFPLRAKFILNHDSGISSLSGTPLDGQIIRFAARANAAQRTFTFGSGIRLSTGLSSRVFTIPSGQVLLGSLEYESGINAWVLTAATVSVT